MKSSNCVTFMFIKQIINNQLNLVAAYNNYLESLGLESDRFDSESEGEFWVVQFLGIEIYLPTLLSIAGEEPYIFFSSFGGTLSFPSQLHKTTESELLRLYCLLIDGV